MWLRGRSRSPIFSLLTSRAICGLSLRSAPFERYAINETSFDGSTMKVLPVIAACVAYFALGGLWFAPLFGQQSEKAVGLLRHVRWKPSVVYYIGPLLGCLAAASANPMIVQWAQATTLKEYLLGGLAVGLGYAAVIAPAMPRPALFAAVVGGYHLLGLLLASAVLYSFG